MSQIAIIPARGGSKRIPRKNIKNFLGKPIIAYSIEAALKSEIFDEVMVSTDDEEIAKIAESFGAKVPFIRSTENSNDFATTIDVLFEVFEKYQVLNRSFEIGCCIYPTAPFVNEEKLKNAFHTMINGGFDSVYPVQQYSFPIQRAVFFESDKLKWVNPENAMKRSQDLPKTYHDAGQFYMFRVVELLKNRAILTPNSSGIIISELEAQDIDNETDWQLAELKYKIQNNERI